MASTLPQAERFVKIINQQLEILKEERNTVIDAVDQRISQVQSEVNAWINGGLVNHTTYAEINNRIQEILTLFIDKSVEISGVDVGSDASHNMTMRFAKLEEAVDSLKKKTENVKDKIENVDKILKNVSTQQEKDHNKLEILTNAKLKSENKLKNKITDLEKEYQDIKLNIDDLVGTVTNVDVKLNRLENENNSFNISMNELNQQISSVRTCSNDVLMSIQDLSKSVESTNQHYNEMSNKMNQLKISMNLMSSQCTEQFENMSSLNKDKTDDLIGMVCQLLAKRLTPLEYLNETLNKKVNVIEKERFEKNYIEDRVAEITNKITEIELKCNPPKVGFFACKKYVLQSEGLCTITSYNKVCAYYGDHFDQSTGIFTAPLNGLYLITIMTGSSSKTITNTINGYRIRNDTSIQSIFCHPVSINQTITRCAKIAAGDKLYLNCQTTDKHENDNITITFACYLIQKF
ncbi:unnamed protein product [Lymnaea stagnalis]|uniref:C1q domain-containing protein n=1 Tax=Lymnaea stagnalis TaxID=6523 RepID=A0AAV2I8Q2_LYMST